MTDKLKPTELVDCPFPDCTNKCSAIEHLGIGECENICKKFEEDQEHVNHQDITNGGYLLNKPGCPFTGCAGGRFGVCNTCGT